MKRLNVLALSAVMVMAVAVPVFAETSTVPIKFTQEPITLNVTVSESIDISLDENTVTASVTDLVVQNNATVGNVKVTNIAVADTGEYAITADTEDFHLMPMNTKKYSLVHEGHDFSTGDSAVDYTINPEASQNIVFTSKVAPTLVKVDSTQIANATITIALDTTSVTTAVKATPNNASAAE